MLCCAALCCWLPWTGAARCATSVEGCPLPAWLQTLCERCEHVIPGEIERLEGQAATLEEQRAHLQVC